MQMLHLPSQTGRTDVYRIQAGPQPKELLHEVRASPLDPNAPPPTYDGLSSASKNAMRSALFKAQCGRCAYCEEKIECDGTRTKIEHFHPQRFKGTPGKECYDRVDVKNLDHADVEWGNLVLCCVGTSGPSKSERHCDTRKGDQHICHSWYNPRHIDPSWTSLVRVEVSGKAVPRHFPGDKDDAQRVLDDVLNINHRLLRDNRGEVFRAYLEQFKKFRDNDRQKTPAADLRHRFAVKVWQDADQRKSYPSTLESVANWVESGGR